MQADAIAPLRIERIRVKNFRALRDFELRRITPLTALIGPNGSGKSTVLDAFAFLAECFDYGLRRAWETRDRFRELKSRNARGAVLIEVAYREGMAGPLLTYHLEVDEEDGRPTVAKEWLRWRSASTGAPFKILDFANGVGRVVPSDLPDAQGERVDVHLSSGEILVASVLGQLAEYPHIVALRDFILGWHVSGLLPGDARKRPEAGPQEKLSETGDNLANVLRYLSEEHPKSLEFIIGRLRQRMPGIQDVEANQMPDGRLTLQIRDAPFAEPVLARFASNGALKMLAYLSLLHGPVRPPFVCIKKPENSLHPRLLYGLAEECRESTDATQIFVTTHSPIFLDALHSHEVRMLWRDENGYTQCRALNEDRKIKTLMEAGAQLGDLWMEGQFGVGDTLTRGGMPGRVGGDSRHTSCPI